MSRPGITGRIFRLPMAIAIALALGLLGARAAGTELAAKEAASPTAMAVEISGSVPGLSQAELRRYVAEQMNATRVGWQFVAADKADEEPNRVEWSFTTGPSANGAVRTYGFSRAMMERLVGAHHYVTIEAKLYWHGQYQTVMLGHVTMGAAAPDPDLTTLIGKMTRLVLAYPIS
jgi:hypothetical protein